jgi:steroid 5-alpha-reductase
LLRGVMMEEGRIEQGLLSQEQQLGDDGSDVVFKFALWGMYLVAALMYFGVTRITAPFGRHTRRGWGPSMSAREAWIVMESPALFVMALVYHHGQHQQDVVPHLLLRLFQLHYIHRCLVYPFRIRNDGKVMPILVCAIGFLFNFHNAYLQARWISHYGDYAASWLTSPQFMLGALLFLLGFGVNIWADSVLLNLRTDGRDKSYKIPRGFLYEYVTCPNYLGEIVEWLGWGVMTNSWAGFAFFLCTLANLTPRAAVHHQWYLKKFSDYPASRKALIPFVY